MLPSVSSFEGWLSRGKEKCRKGGAARIWYWETPMELEDARVGTSVLVRVDYKKAHRQGAVGRINKCYQVPNYEAFEVLFPDGQTELFWEHQLEGAKKSSLKPKKQRWWVFW
jgi:hypothetical protein